MDLIADFGPKTAALITGLVLLYLAMIWAPAIWPFLRARFQQPRLPRPLLFSAIVAGLVYGWFFMLFAVLALPGSFFLAHIVPQLEALGKPYGAWFVPGLRFLVQWWWLIMPPSLLLLTWLVVRMLAKRWAAICSKLAA